MIKQCRCIVVESYYTIMANFFGTSALPDNWWKEKELNDYLEQYPQKLLDKMGSRSGVSNLADLPYTTLVRIIFNLHARERISLGNSCKRLNKIVYGDRQLLKALNFPDKSLSTGSDIRQFLIKKSTQKHLQILHVPNFDLVSSDLMLLNCIGIATNLVEMNVIATKFKGIVQLGGFLKPLEHLRKLWIEWPKMTKTGNIQRDLQSLRKPFSKLTYLVVSLPISGYSKNFVQALQMCHELQFLVLWSAAEYVVDQHSASTPWSEEPSKLQQLLGFSVCGPEVSEVKQHLMTMLPDPEKWRDRMEAGHPVPETFYLDELNKFSSVKWMKNIPYLNPQGFYTLPYFSPLECFFTNSHETNNKKSLKDLYSLSRLEDHKTCVLKMKDAERLIKNKHRVSCLTLNHDIEEACDVHLLGFTFTKLDELHLCNIVRNSEKSLGSTPGKEASKKIRKKKKLQKKSTLEEPAADRPLRPKSSFQKLVENIPELETLGIEACQMRRDLVWDLDALHLIPSWKHLKSLTLANIPIKDGTFLIEIGKQCKDLDELNLVCLGSSRTSYTNELCEMLSHCQRLQVFDICDVNIGQVSDVFFSLLHKSDLGYVRVETSGNQNSTRNLFRSIDQLAKNLRFFSCIIDEMDMELCDELNATFELWQEIGECSPHFSHFVGNKLRDFAPNTWNVVLQAEPIFTRRLTTA